MLYCDWCAEPIEEADFATLEVGGTYRGGKAIRTRARAYHTSYEYSEGPSESACVAKMLALLNSDREFKTPDAGMGWRLVPMSETHNSVYTNGYDVPTVGTTPLEVLDLTEWTYSRLTKAGVFTVEHLVDARLRGQDMCLTVKALARVDAILLDRGLLTVGHEISTGGTEASS